MNPLQMIQKSLATIAKQMPNAEAQLEPDTRSMLINVISMLQEVLGAGQAPPPVETMVEEEMADTSQEDEQMEQVGKEKKVEKPIGDEGADTRLEDQTPITDNALSEIGKSLGDLTRLLKGNQVQKTRVPAQNTAMMNTLATMTQVMKGLADRVNQNQQFMGKFMETIGISDDIVQKALEPPAVSTTHENRPVQNADMMSFMTEVMKAINTNNGNNGNTGTGKWPSNPQNNPWNRQGDVRKSLDPVLDHLLTK